ncbi:cation-translocating P-type ATPase [Corynebacterium pacaense]|uniref:cation-translocating P-type ATPase n=1 Tax=Corynebacterium pacaense TaxID=1816684 RepID=UPI0009BB253C|nr:HAD-IC family P-type ATPase [Corynebacterium pacaense]
MTTRVPATQAFDLAYAHPAEEVLAGLGSGMDGLSSPDAERAVADFGPNALPVSAPLPAWRRFISHFDDVLIYILLAAAALKAILQEWVDFSVIAFAAVAIASVGFVQEGRAQKAMESIKSMLSLHAQVLRDGTWSTVDAEAIVPGDVIRVRSGDRVPADARLLRESNLQVDESALTGESVAAIKSIDAVGESAGVGDRSCMIFSGTIVSTGTAEAVVTATGTNTEIGKITSLVNEVESTETPLSRQLQSLAKKLSILVGILAFVLILVGRIFYDYTVDELVSAAIGFAVAAVPEGLPAMVTITLALGVQQMARRNAITRKMTAVETLGAVTTICSDKTGTLTQNEMTARVVVTDSGAVNVQGTGYAPQGHLTAADAQVDPESRPDLHALLIAAGLCNNARVEEKEQGWVLVGQPTEGALTVLALKSGVDLTAVRIGEVPFESAHKFAATVDDLPGGSRLLHCVGAPDRLLDRCDSQLRADASTENLDRAGWERRITELSDRGLRVLGVARRDATDLDASDLGLHDVDGLAFIGVVGIVDPPRPEAVSAIAETHEAGIRVKMITGDHAGTAVAIARELGIVEGRGSARVLSGTELEAMSQEELRRVARDVDVYARTSPEHKIRIVRALQSQGEVVAMTGDGVNDAPSITRADVGVAMGIKGTEATKEAADIVLADDNFATIERAVEEGRRIYDNIRKSVVFLLPTNGAQSLVILVAILLGMSLPLSPVQILWINLVTSLTLSLPLATEPVEPGTMHRAPRAANEQVLSRSYFRLVVAASLIIGAMTFAMYLTEIRLGTDYAQAQTAAVTVLAFSQLAFLFSCRILGGSALTPRAVTGNRIVWYAVLALVGLQLLFIYAPFMHVWFDSAPLGLRDWGLVAASSIAVFLLVELVKAVLRRSES